MAQSLIRGSTQILSASITADRFAASLNLATSQLADAPNFILRGGSVAFTAAQSMGGFNLTNVAAGVAGTDAANLSQVQALINGIAIQRARGVSVANQTLSCLPTIDAITYTAGQVVLLTAQTTTSQNGPWAVAAGAWTRPANWAAASTQKSTMFLVEEGTTYHDTKWITITDAVVVDTTAVVVTQDSSGISYVAGTGILLTGNSFSAKIANGLGLDGSSNIQVVANGTSLNVSASGVKITDGTAAQVMLAAAGGGATFTTMSGDVTIGSTGITTVTNTAGTGFVKYTNFVNNETPTGTINSANTAFTLAFTPQVSSVELILNGQVLDPGAGNDYTISGTAITMLFAPTTGDKLRAYYIK